MAGYVKPLTGRPAALVPVAVAAWEEAWRRRGMSVVVLGVLSALTTDDAGRRLAEEPERDAIDALTTAWNTVDLIFAELMDQRGYLPGTVSYVREQAHAALSAVEREAAHERTVWPEEPVHERT